MKLKDFREIVKDGLRNCSAINVSFRTCDNCFVAVVTNTDMRFMLAQSVLNAASKLYSEYGFFFYVECMDFDVLRLKIYHYFS